MRGNNIRIAMLKFIKSIFKKPVKVDYLTYEKLSNELQAAVKWLKEEPENEFIKGFVVRLKKALENYDEKIPVKRSVSNYEPWDRLNMTKDEWVVYFDKKLKGYDSIQT